MDGWPTLSKLGGFFLYYKLWRILNTDNKSSLKILGKLIFLQLKFTFFHCMGGSSAMVHVWKSENNLEEPAVSFEHVGSRGQTQVFRLGGKLSPEPFCWPMLTNV